MRKSIQHYNLHIPSFVQIKALVFLFTQVLIVRANEGQIEAIAVDTGDVDAIIRTQDNLLEQIEALTGLGGLRTSKNQIASGVAIIEERKQLHRLAKSKARLMEVTEEMIYTYAARFMDQRWAGEVNYNTDYEAHDTNYRMALIKSANEMVGENEIVKSTNHKRDYCYVKSSRRHTRIRKCLYQYYSR